MIEDTTHRDPIQHLVGAISTAWSYLEALGFTRAEQRDVAAVVAEIRAQR